MTNPEQADQSSATAPAHPRVCTDEGMQRKGNARDTGPMLVESMFEHGALGKRHHHVHMQSSHVRSGVFDFTVGGMEHRLKPGDSLVIPSNVEHGCRAIVAGSLIDTFAPCRDDFL